jgi:hypothetical protein
MNDKQKDKIKARRDSDAREQLWEIMDFYNGIIDEVFDWNVAGSVAKNLWGVAGRKKPGKVWGGNYVVSVLKDQISPSEIFVEAIDRLSKILIKGENRVEVMLSDVSVRAPDGTPAGAIITKDAVQCEKPGCDVWFFPNSWNHRYHVRECYVDHKEIKRSIK